MTDRGQKRQTSAAIGPVAAVMGYLGDADQPAGLELLAQALASAVSAWPAVASLALVANPEQALLLDGAWVHRPDECLLVTGESVPVWTEMPDSWQRLATAFAGHDEQVVPLKGRVPDGFFAAEAANPCFLFPVTANGHLLALILVAATPGLPADLAGEIGSLIGAVDVVATLWLERRRLAAELALAHREKQSLSKLKSLQGRFVALAAHEFKSPLTSITAYTDVLRSQMGASGLAEAGEFLDVIRTESDRLLRMVNRVLDFTRMEYGARLLTRQPVDLRLLAEATVKGLQPAIHEKNLTVTISCGQAVPRASVDEDLIQQVLVNLIGNAVKFTPRAGTVTVTVSERESSVAVSVRDDGPGIPLAERRRIFREFYRASGEAAKQEGSGLGLAIVQHIVNLHGGHIDVKAVPGGGAEFVFVVPKEIAAPDANNTIANRILIDELLRLFAELTQSRAVALWWHAEAGDLVPAGVMGWPSCPEQDSEPWRQAVVSGRAMCAEIRGHDQTRGLVMTGRRRGSGGYGPADRNQLAVLAEIAEVALSRPAAIIGHTVEAVRLLMRIRLTGVPTSSPAALDLVARLAGNLGLDGAEIRRLQYAAALHDAGMARVEDEIVLGVARLNIDERDEVERHVEQGVDLMSPLLTDDATMIIMRDHHEWFDGTGYPAGLAKEKIPLGARILAVVDAWCALTSTRSFRDQMNAAEAMTEMTSYAGSQFDPQVVEALQELLVADGILSPESQLHSHSSEEI